MQKDHSNHFHIDSRRSGAATTAHGVDLGSSTRSNNGNSASIGADTFATTHGKDISSSASSSSQRNNANTGNPSATTSYNGGADNTTSSNISIANFSASNNFVVSSTDEVLDEKTSPRSPRDATPSQKTPGQGPFVENGLGSNVSNKNNDTEQQQQQKQQEDEDEKKGKPGVLTRFYDTCKTIMFHSWVNVLLVFVPVGIIVKGLHVNPGVVFAMNAIAIVPLAGLLSHATESVASKLGDTVGALLNVTFGNAVELIIFLALVKNEIRIVQASLLGSILANLLLILGMCFFLGGLRFREQIYNSTVTQMSACLLSLSVISLVLPTAFHASFRTLKKADEQSLKISRGTSVILLLVYIVYLLFQLKSHAYMYESTPQHIVDAESAPGPAIGWLDTSSSESGSDSDSDSDSSHSSGGTVRKTMRKVLRSGKRRKSSLTSVDTETRASSATVSLHGSEGSSSRPQLQRLHSSGATGASAAAASEDAIDEDKPRKHRKHRKRHHKHKKSKKRSRENITDGDGIELEVREQLEAFRHGEPRCVDFAQQNAAPAVETGEPSQPNGRRPLPALRSLSIKSFAPAVFTQPAHTNSLEPVPGSPVPRVRFGIRRTNSLPDRLNQYGNNVRPPGALFPARVPSVALISSSSQVEAVINDDHLSRTASILLLLFSTALVAVCAEFLVDSIDEVVETSPLGEVFIGLIILPIVGNAAEHVTAITVAMKNKMDLAIGVAVGSSIQIALFITPLVVIIGWALGRDMSLYFTLFETVCLFVSAFIVNFLVLDGRSNYLEGALLCATYVIIAVVAFFYPNSDEVNALGA